jgi:response regulator RpfG family c-di-GMP phosphodiesterase
MKRHTIYGSQMLVNAESRLLRLAAKIAIAHHEHYDGSGYPYGLKGEAIPVEARIVSVADVFDALVSKRVYKGAWTVEDAKTYIRNQEGKLFDPAVIDCLFKSFDDVLAAMEEENRRIQEDDAIKAAFPEPVQRTPDQHPHL